MAQIWEYIKIALMNIKSNKGRSILTMLGIIIGISSVIMVISIGNGVRGQVNSELEGIAGGQIAFYVDSTRKDTTVTFDQSDFDAIMEHVDHVKGVTRHSVSGEQQKDRRVILISVCKQEQQDCSTGLLSRSLKVNILPRMIMTVESMPA